MNAEQKPRTDNQSKTSVPQSPGASEEGVVIKSVAAATKAGVERLSKNEPGELQTEITVGGGDTEQLDDEGRRIRR